MKIKTLFIVSLIAFMAVNVTAARSVAFLTDGSSINDTIIDMSSRTGHIEFRNSPKVHRSRVWMINFENARWDFAGERDRLSGNTDTIFLLNGHIMNVKIVDFSSRRQMFEFLKGGAVHESKVARIYFCCTPLPAAYRQMKPASPNRGKRYSTSFLVDGRIVKHPLSYLNSRKTGFRDGLQINTHDLWLINFIDDQWNFPGEQQRLDRRLDTIYMKDGNIIYDNVVDFNERSGTFRLQNNDPVHESHIKRLYFCCQRIPEAFRKKGTVRYRKDRRK